ncbi:MAG: orotate phosphoribosyltransferase [bacterium]
MSKILSESIAREYAAHVLGIKAVTLKMLPDYYEWASGWHSPIYCDNRKTLSYPEIRTFVKEYAVAFIRKNYPQIEVMAGVAIGGIPQATLIADALSIPLVYVRDEKKEHGLKNIIEGVLVPGQKVGFFEDLLSTGGSTIRAVEAIQNAGGEVLFTMAGYSYQFPKMEDMFAKKNIPIHTISNYEILIQVAVEKGYIAEEDLSILAEWRTNPEVWGK